LDNKSILMSQYGKDRNFPFSGDRPHGTRIH
jgi:hypothetical protein